MINRVSIAKRVLTASVMNLFCCVFIGTTYGLSVHELNHMITKTESTEGVELMPLGNHVIAEFMGCINLDAYDDLERVLCDAAQAAHATVINVMSHRFSPQGMTGLVLLSESHISIHTWPEYGYASIDIYTCGEHVDVHAAIDVLKQFFKPSNVREITVDRGCDLSTPLASSDFASSIEAHG